VPKFAQLALGAELRSRWVTSHLEMHQNNSGIPWVNPLRTRRLSQEHSSASRRGFPRASVELQKPYRRGATQPLLLAIAKTALAEGQVTQPSHPKLDLLLSADLTCIHYTDDKPNIHSQTYFLHPKHAAKYGHRSSLDHYSFHSSDNSNNSLDRLLRSVPSN
jgi:hypothetical protein